MNLCIRGNDHLGIDEIWLVNLSILCVLLENLATYVATVHV